MVLDVKAELSGRSIKADFQDHEAQNGESLKTGKGRKGVWHDIKKKFNLHADTEQATVS